MIGKIAIGALVLFYAAGVQAAEPGKVEAGRRLAQSNCGACHAVGRTGASPRREAPPLRTLKNRYPPEDMEEALAEGISVGHPDMPHVLWEARDIQAFTTYLRSLQPTKPRVKR